MHRPLFKFRSAEICQQNMNCLSTVIHILLWRKTTLTELLIDKALGSAMCCLQIHCLNILCWNETGQNILVANKLNSKAHILEVLQFFNLMTQFKDCPLTEIYRRITTKILNKASPTLAMLIFTIQVCAVTGLEYMLCIDPIETSDEPSIFCNQDHLGTP